jgi:hypothetical protein
MVYNHYSEKEQSTIIHDLRLKMFEFHGMIKEMGKNSALRLIS